MGLGAGVGAGAGVEGLGLRLGFGNCGACAARERGCHFVRATY